MFLFGHGCSEHSILFSQRRASICIQKQKRSCGFILGFTLPPGSGAASVCGGSSQSALGGRFYLCLDLAGLVICGLCDWCLRVIARVWKRLCSHLTYFSAHNNCDWKTARAQINCKWARIYLCWLAFHFYMLTISANDEVHIGNPVASFKRKLLQLGVSRQAISKVLASVSKTFHLP